MIDDHDVIRHLEEGGQELWEPAAPPKLDLAAATAQSPRAAASAKPSARRGFGLSSGRHWRLRPLVAIGGALASVAIGLALGAVIFNEGSGSSNPPVLASTATPVKIERVDLQRFGDGPAPSTASAVASVFASSNGKTMKVSVKNLPVAPHGAFYELWAIGNDSKMVSLGNVKVGPDGTGTAVVPVPVSLRRYPILDISLEPADGNPTHSGHSVLRSPA